MVHNQKKIQPLSQADIDQVKKQVEAEILLRQREGRWTGGVLAHESYQTKPVQWITEKLLVPEHTLRWSANPEYQACSCTTIVCNPTTRAIAGSLTHIWDGDKDPIITALERLAEGKSLSIGSGTTLGKTHTIAAGGALWFLACFKNSIVMSLAPKEDQLLHNMWKEIGKKWPLFKAMFPKAVLLTGKLRMLGDTKETEGQQEVWAASAFAAGVGAEEEFSQRLKGFHEKYMLWIIEEMPGVVQPKIETIIKTATAKFNPVIGMGQPTHQHDTLSNFGKRDWVTKIRMSAYDFPNVVCDREVIEGGRSRESVFRDIKDAGGDENDPEILSQVRGIAPAQSTRALIRREWCEAAAKKQGDAELIGDGTKSLGVDVADSPTGDQSAISRWHGACCTEVDAFRMNDAGEVGRKVFHEMNADKNDPILAKHVGVDYVGVGASTINELKRLGKKVRAIGSKTMQLLDTEGLWSKTTEEDGQEKAAGPKVIESERYANMRSQIYWRLREDLRLGRIALPNDPMLFEELTAMEYEEVNEKIIVGAKDDLKVKLRRSPDRADAVVYGNWVRPRTPKRKKVQAVSAGVHTNVDQGLERYLARQEKEQNKHQKAWDRKLKKALRGRKSEPRTTRE